MSVDPYVIVVWTQGLCKSYTEPILIDYLKTGIIGRNRLMKKYFKMFQKSNPVLPKHN